MSPAFSRHLEKALTLALALGFFVPLVLTGALRLPYMHGRATLYLRNLTLSGQRSASIRAAFTIPALLSSKFQGSLARNYDANFPGRELLIRLFNELYLRVFRTTAAEVLVGPRYSLILRNYAEEYCLERGSPDKLAPLVTDLRRLQDSCDARGIAFALVITPSKASIYPEGLPSNWLQRYRPGPRAYDQFVPLLHAKGVRFVDGHHITATLKPTARAPLFPLGGVHWSKEAAVATANALLELLASEKLDVQPVRDYDIQLSRRPVGQDADLVNLCNLLLPMSYPVAAVTVQPVPTPKMIRPNVVFVSGSFMFTLLEVLDATRQFSEFQYYFYYRDTKGCYNDGEMHTLAEPVPRPNFDTDIFSADALVLEANEQTICEGVPHLQRFLHDALATLPDPHAAKAAFRRESWLKYEWGDTLSFVKGGPPVSPVTVSGLSDPTSIGAFTVGSVATVRLSTLPLDRDAVLEVNAGAFLVGSRLPEQRVNVEINGHVFGSWTWRANTPPHHELTIPGETFRGGDLRLRFLIARPGSPAEFGLSGDESKYGIILKTVRLRPIGKN